MGGRAPAKLREVQALGHPQQALVARPERGVCEGSRRDQVDVHPSEAGAIQLAGVDEPECLGVIEKGRLRGLPTRDSQVHVGGTWITFV